jgi:hypothetical protein
MPNTFAQAPGYRIMEVTPMFQAKRGGPCLYSPDGGKTWIDAATLERATCEHCGHTRTIYPDA